MFSRTTRGIKVSVIPQYQPNLSRPNELKFIFSYQVTIENFAQQTVQLLRRHWIIQDATTKQWEVEGEGVIGQTPIIAPGASHQYSSWCPISTGMGKMSGSFLMLNKMTNQHFKVIIPEFKLIADFKMN